MTPQKFHFVIQDFFPMQFKILIHFCDLHSEKQNEFTLNDISTKI